MQGTVYIGQSLDPPHHEAAIKVYPSRYRREVEAMRRLSGDPHVVDVYDTGVLPDGQVYLAMQKGTSLESPMGPAEVVSLGETIAETLDRAHLLGVLHRDLHPGNILLGETGSPLLAGFGIPGETAAYAAPELFADHPATVRSDVYSLAATLYFLLAGYPPQHDRWSKTPERIPGVPLGMMKVLLQALSLDPNGRYATAGAFAAALREIEVPSVIFAGVDPKAQVTMGPGIQPGLLATALTAAITVGILGLFVASPGWMLWWLAITLLIGLTSGIGKLPGFLTFAASMSVAFVIAVRSYEESPFGSLGWLLAACLAGITAVAWGQSTSAVRLRWFAWRQRLRQRRWWGQASARSELTALELIPAARFMRLAEGTCHYAVICGGSVALVRWASWSNGRYIVTDDEVRRDDGVWGQGGTELARARRGLLILPVSDVDRTIRRRVFLAVDTPGDLRQKNLRGDLTVCHTRELAQTLGGWLADDPYHLDLELLALMLPLAENG